MGGIAVGRMGIDTFIVVVDNVDVKDDVVCGNTKIKQSKFIFHDVNFKDLYLSTRKTCR